jgi:hypothetical protein
MKITKDIIRAINCAIRRYGNRYQFSLKAEIPQQTIKRWIEGRVFSIDDAVWDKLYPHIKEYIAAQNCTGHSQIIITIKATEDCGVQIDAPWDVLWRDKLTRAEEIAKRMILSLCSKPKQPNCTCKERGKKQEKE